MRRLSRCPPPPGAPTPHPPRGGPPPHAARAEQAILKELDDLRTGPITEEELEDCRLSLLSGMAGIEDSLGGIETWYYMEVLRGGAVQTPDEARAALRAVTREDVRAILRQLTLSVSYLLTREEGPAHV